jgi:hypothetical protein
MVARPPVSTAAVPVGGQLGVDRERAVDAGRPADDELRNRVLGVGGPTIELDE